MPNAAGCDLQYAVESQVGGKIAQLGQRLIDGAAKSMADDFFKKFDVEARARYGVVETPAEVSSAPVSAAQAEMLPAPKMSQNTKTVFLVFMLIGLFALGILIGLKIPRG